MRKGLCLFIVLLFIFLCPAAHALPMLSIEADPGTYGAIPDGEKNDLVETLYGPGTTRVEGYYGSTIALTEAANLTLRSWDSRPVTKTISFSTARSFSARKTMAPI